MKKGWRLLLPLGLVLGLVLAAGNGRLQAHTGGTTGHARVTIDGQTVRYSLTLALDSLEKVRPPVVDHDSLAAIVAHHVTVIADETPCAALPGAVQPPTPDRSSVVIVVHYACAAPVRSLLLRDHLFALLGRDHHTLASVEWAGGNTQLFFDPDQSEARVTVSDNPAGSQPSTGGGRLSLFLLGVEHILVGFDHILFVFALTLGGGRLGPLIGIVTAFTVAHSLTLGLAVLGFARPPGWIIEPLIAASIAYVAFENIFLDRAPSRRWLVSFLFGLVHGFGFAGALMEIDLPQDRLLSSLLLFNLGVETGQAMIIALLFPPLLWLSRFPWQRRAVTTISAVVLVAALGLLAERTLAG